MGHPLPIRRRGRPAQQAAVRGERGPAATKDWTYDDLVQLTQRLHDPAKNQAGIEIGQNGIQYMAGTFMRNFGGKVLNEARNRAMHSVIPNESKSADAGWEFVMHDTSPVGQKHIQWNFGSFDISSIPSVANNPESLKLQPWRTRMHELMADAKEPSFFPHPGLGDIGAAITSAIAPFLRGEEGPKATMDVLKRDVERLMAQFRVP